MHNNRYLIIHPQSLVITTSKRIHLSHTVQRKKLNFLTDFHCIAHKKINMDISETANTFIFNSYLPVTNNQLFFIYLKCSPNHSYLFGYIMFHGVFCFKFVPR